MMADMINAFVIVDFPLALGPVMIIFCGWPKSCPAVNELGTTFSESINGFQKSISFTDGVST